MNARIHKKRKTGTLKTWKKDRMREKKKKVSEG